MSLIQFKNATTGFKSSIRQSATVSTNTNLILPPTNGVTDNVLIWDVSGETRWGYINSIVTGNGVISVNLTAPPEFTTSGGGSGNVTLTFSKISEPQSTFYAAPDNMAGLPVFRIISVNDLPLIDVAHGGTGTNTIGALGSVPYSNGSSFSYSPVGAPGQVLTLSGGGTPFWTTVGGGTVFSVNASGGATGFSFSGGPITTTGILTMDGILNANHGGTGIDGSTLVTGDTFYASGPGSYTVIPAGPNGSVFTIAGGIPSWVVPGVGGTVTSVGLALPSNLFNITVSPITTNGTLTAVYQSIVQNLMFASPDGLAGTPDFRAIVNNDLPTIDVTHGGTGNNTIGPANTVPYSNGTQLIYTPVGLPNQVLSLVGGIPQWATVGGGTVFSVDGSGGATGLLLSGGPITTSGILTLGGLLNTLSGGTGNGGPFVDGDLLYYDSGLGYFQKLSIGSINQVLTVTGGLPSWANPAGTGTLTSVYLNMPAIFSVGGSPVSGSSGTFSVTLNNANANEVFAGPTGGGPSTPSFRLLINADLPLVDIPHGGTNGTASPVAGGIAYGNGTQYQFTAAGTLGQVLTSNGAGAPTWTNLTGGGTVTSITVNDSTTGLLLTATPNPITTTGTINLTGLLAPTFGGTGLATYNTGDMLYASAPNVLTKLPIGVGGEVLTVFGGVPQWAVAGGGGTVTSVGLSAPVNLFTVSGSPVMGAGTLTLTYASQAANVVFASPDSAVGTPSFRSLVNNDLPLVNIAHGGSNTNVLGGSGSVLYSDGTKYDFSAVGGVGQVLTSNGAAAPSWTTIAGSGTVTSVAGGVGVSGLTITASPNPITTTGALTIDSGTLLINYGGTNSSVAPTAGAVAYGDGTKYNFTSVGTLGQILTSGGVGTPTWSTLSGVAVTSFSAGTTGLLPAVPTTGAVTLSGVLAVANGGTNSSTALNNNRIMVSSGGAIVEAAALTNGQLLIGSTGAAPVAANITAGTNVSILNTAGAITISATSGVLTVGPIIAGANANAASITGTTLNMYNGTSTTRGVGNIQTYVVTNTAVGSLAFPQYSVLTSFNSAFGEAALSAGSTLTAGANRNTAIGYRTLTALTSGTDNTAVGSDTGLVLTIGTENTLTGSNAGQTLSTGTRNIAIGYLSMSNVTTGGNNICLGANTTCAAVGNNNSLVIGSSAVGAGSNTTVIHPSYVRAAVNANVLGYNTVTGEVTSQASGALSIGPPSTTPTFNGLDITGTVLTAHFGSATNIGMGYIQTLTGVSSTAVGRESYPQWNVAGTANTVFGYQCMGRLSSVTTATNNVAIGNQVMQVVTSGFGNAMVGSGAAQALTTGSNNACFGYLAGNAMVANNENTAIGNQAYASSTSGTNNTFVGSLAGFAAGSGSDNTAVGRTALTGVSTGTRNVAIGQNAMNGTTTGSDNICIGRNALCGLNSDSSCIVIGTNVTGVGSNTTTIGTAYIPAGVGTSFLKYNTANGAVTRDVSSLRYKTLLPDDPPVGQYTNRLFDLMPRAYTIIGDPNNTARIGYIAEEVEQIKGPLGNPVFGSLMIYTELDDPDAPPTQKEEREWVLDADGVPQEVITIIDVPAKKQAVESINYAGFVVPLVELCKQQQQQLDTQQQQLDTQQQQINALIARLAAAGIP